MKRMTWLGWALPAPVPAASVAICLATIVACGAPGTEPPAQTSLPSETDEVVVTSLAPEPPGGIMLTVSDNLTVGSPIDYLSQLGFHPLNPEIVSLDGGEVLLGQPRQGLVVLDFPAFSPSDNPPRAVLRLTPDTGGEDPLAPGDADFWFGADFRRDGVTGRTAVDNGDNLIQRGLASDSSQYKIEVNSGRPVCRVQGSSGMVEVQAEAVTKPDRWYRVRCTRRGNTVVLTVSEQLADGRTSDMTTEAVGRTGSLTWPKKETPLSVGGKLAANGAVIKSATDQFNGSVSTPVVVIDG